MKNEEFDDAIRRKLDGIEPEFTGADIDKVLRYARGKASPIKWLRGNWLYLALPAAAMVGVTAWIVVNHGNKQPEIGGQNKVKTELQVPAPAATVATDENPGQKSASASPKTGNSHTGNITPLIQKPVTPKANNINTSLQVQIPSDNHSETHNNQVFKLSAPVTQKGTDNAIEEITQSTISPETQKLPEQEKILPDTTEHAEVLTATNNGKTGITSGQPVDTVSHDGKEVKSLKPLFLNEIRLTSSVPVSNQSFGMGLGAEFLAGQHAGLSIGLRYNHTYTETFFTKEALRKPRHDRMGPEFHKRFDGEDVFIDISVSNHIVQLPVSLSYNIPLNQGFKLHFAIGTDFDLHVRQSIDYTHLFDSSGMNRMHLDVTGKATPVNTMYLSAGFEKEWNRLMLQFSPFLSPHIKQVYYKPREIEYGINVSLKYSIWKK